MAAGRVANERFREHIMAMTNDFVGMPMLEVVTPSGAKELWAVAAPHDEAVSIVEREVPAGSIVRPTNRRLPVSPKMERFGPYEARRVEPWP
jgi:hypothetical protein